MKTSEALRRVRGHLGDGGFMYHHERYTCHAIDWAYYARLIGDRDRTRLKRLIKVHLGEDIPSLEYWLYRNHQKDITNTPAYLRRIMATRKAWLTHLIEHYEAKGD